MGPRHPASCPSFFPITLLYRASRRSTWSLRSQAMIGFVESEGIEVIGVYHVKVETTFPLRDADETVPLFACSHSLTIGSLRQPRGGFKMKKIGFLSFGHWNDSRQSATRSARDVLQPVHRAGRRSRGTRCRRARRLLEQAINAITFR